MYCSGGSNDVSAAKILKFELAVTDMQFLCQHRLLFLMSVSVLPGSCSVHDDNSAYDGSRFL